MTQPGRAPAWLLYASDWLADRDVRCMNLAARGAYVDLLCVQWNDGSVPMDPEDRARLLGVSLEEEAEVWKRLAGKFPGGVNPRLKRQLSELRSYKKQQAENGKRGAKARWRAHTPGDGDPMATPLAKGVAKDSSSSSSSSSIAPKKKRRKDGAAKPPLESPGVSRVLDAWEVYLETPLSEKVRAAAAKQADLLIRRGGLSDPKAPDAPACQPQTPERIVAAIQWLGSQPKTSGPGDAFSWRPQIQSLSTLRQKWLKIERTGGSRRGPEAATNAVLDLARERGLLP